MPYYPIHTFFYVYFSGLEPFKFIDTYFGLLALCLLLSLSISLLMIPPCIRIACQLQLVDRPAPRKVHDISTPRIGGLPLILAIMGSYTIYLLQEGTLEIAPVIVSLLLTFMTGFIDDIRSLNVWLKLMSQILCVSILIFFADIRISSLYGILGIEELPFLISYAFTLFSMILIMNSFNLIDGINGLSSSLIILVTAVLGAWFYLIGYYPYSLLAISLLGATLGVLYFNWSPAKIFLGDAGTLSSGLIISVLIIEFVELQQDLLFSSPFAIQGVPIVAISILILPLIDTLRVITVRSLNGRSPFRPDRNHIHHKLLDAGYSHSQTTYILVLTNLVFILMFFSLNTLGNLYLLIILLCMLIGCTIFFNYLVGKRQQAF